MLNGLPAGPWRLFGDRSFYGMELDVGGGFLPFHQDSLPAQRPVSGPTSWKARVQFFHTEVPTFSSPFNGREIAMVDHTDEVAYCRFRLRADLLSVVDCADFAAAANVAGSTAEASGSSGVYVEIQVAANADNLSLAVVDFEGGGRSSVTFSPETGAVLRERKVRELPRAIEGTYIHLLPAAPPGRRFEGTMGLYLSTAGHLAFFRRWAAAAVAGGEYATASGTSTAAPRSVATGTDGTAAPLLAVAATELPWETTGFCTDLKWAQGPRLSLCLAFRDNGAYRVRISQVGRQPPIIPMRSAEAYQEDRWNLLYGDDDHPLAI